MPAEDDHLEAQYEGLTELDDNEFIGDDDELDSWRDDAPDLIDDDES